MHFIEHNLILTVIAKACNNFINRVMWSSVASAESNIFLHGKNFIAEAKYIETVTKKAFFLSDVNYRIILIA